MRHDVPMRASAAKPDRTLLVILSVIAGLVVIALVVVFTRGTPEPLELGTPEGVVQRYSVAVIDRDDATAAGYLTQQALDGCEVFDRGPTDDLRIILVSTTVRADTAAVRVSIVTTYDSGPFGVSDYEAEDVFDLVRVDGDWLIQSAPWQLSVCPKTQVAP